MAINLSRNSKVFFTTNVDDSGKLKNSGYTPNNTFELQVLDGFSVTQNSNAEAVTLSESGNTPARGTRSFNTSLAPVDFSFSTYLRPSILNGIDNAEEGVLWNALLSENSPYRTDANTPKALLSTAVTPTFTYNGSSSITFGAASGLPTTYSNSGGTITAGDYVVISGIATASASNVSYFNSLGIITGTPSATSIVVQLLNPVATANNITAANPTLTKVTAQVSNNFAIAGTTGSSTITGITYSYTASTGIGQLTITGTNLGTGNIGTLSTTQVYQLNGITTPTSGPANASDFNAAVTLVSQAPTSLVFKYVKPSTSATTWASFTSPISIGLGSWTTTATNTYVSSAGSDVPVLQDFGIIYIIDQVAYAVDGCALNQVTVDFGLDQIATAQWTGQATALRKIGDGVSVTTSTALFSNTITPGYFVHTGNITSGGPVVYGSYQSKNTSASYVTNKLSTAVLVATNAIKDSAGTTKITANTSHTIPITGGSFSINNNINYSTPANIGVVNSPVFYVLGTRAVSGNLTAYLRTGGAPDTGSLLSNILESIDNSTELLFNATIKLGGATAPYVQIELGSVFLQVPTIDVQQVVSTNIQFVAEGTSITSSVAGFDLTKSNDVVIKYVAN